MTNLRSPTTADLLAQAQKAARLNDWSSLNQCLQQLLSEDETREEDYPRSVSARPREQVQEDLLFLALAVLELGDFQERWDVAKILPLFGIRAIPPLVALMQDNEAELDARWFAINILGKMGHSAVIPSLIDVLETEDEEELRGAAAIALAEMGAATIAALTHLMQSDSTRLLAVRSLAQIRSTGTIDPLLQVVDDPQGEVRALAIEALGSFHDPRIPPVLVNALQDSDTQVRQTAASALGFRADLLPDLDLVGLLEPLLSDPILPVAQKAALSLGRLATPAAIATLARMLQFPSLPEALYLEIIQALGRSDRPEALNYLQQELQGFQTRPFSVAIIQEIILLLGGVPSGLKAQAAHILLELIHGDHPAVKVPAICQTLALALGRLDDRTAVEPLISLLTYPDLGTRLHIIAALKHLDPDRALNQLTAWAKDDSLSGNLREGITIALQEWMSSLPALA